MMNLYKYLFLILIFLSGCKSAQDALSGNKGNNADEFMVEKKNPLVLPPDFEKLPQPGGTKIEAEEENAFDLESKLKKDSVKNKSSKLKIENTSLEDSILKKIKKN